MFMFSGTFFEVARFPVLVQAIVRPLTAGLALDPLAAIRHLAYVATLAAAAFALARRRFGARLFG